MHQVKKNSKYRKFKSVKGQLLELIIMEEKGCLLITVQNTENNFQKKAMVLFLILLWIIIICYHVLNMQLYHLAMITGCLTTSYYFILARTVIQGNHCNSLKIL